MPSSDVAMSIEEMSQCKITFEALRSERDVNIKIRKDARNTFWTNNKLPAQNIFSADDREDIKEILDSMRLQLRLVEKKYAKALVGTASVAYTTEYALNLID
jgi:hypothetical protein